MGKTDTITTYPKIALYLFFIFFYLFLSLFQIEIKEGYVLKIRLKSISI